MTRPKLANGRSPTKEEEEKKNKEKRKLKT